MDVHRSYGGNRSVPDKLAMAKMDRSETPAEHGLKKGAEFKDHYKTGDTIFGFKEGQSDVLETLLDTVDLEN